MHLSDGEIRSYQDGMISADERSRLETHLGTCDRCQGRAADFQKGTERIATHLEILEPSDKPIPVSMARARMSARLEDDHKEQNNMWHKMTNRVPRQAWVALAVVAILAVSLTFAPVRRDRQQFPGVVPRRTDPGR